MADPSLIRNKLEHARRELLDLTTRNRLINTSRSNTRSGRLDIVDERAEEVFRILVQEKRAMSFSPRFQEREDSKGGDDETELMLQPNEDDEQMVGLADRHTDANLQTALTSEQLQRRLLKLYYDARTFEEEQGVNILYLAIGFLKWFEDDTSDKERFAPLLLIPVQLDRKSANARFRLRNSEDDITTNLSLQEKLKVDFGLRLPDMPEVDEFSPAAYFAEVRKAIETKPRWRLLDHDMVLWFFSFSKFLMYRDLKPETWSDERQIGEHPLVTALLQDGFRREASICPLEENIDGFLQPLDMIHVMDADSSQAVTIEEVRRGRNLVIQGPPGTGKSQTIANLIATAVKDGKKVLFVAEKMAALEVVKRRLDKVGLGDMCLELHSHKANKRAILQELDRALSLGRPNTSDVSTQADDLRTYRDKLNRHAEILHTYFEPAHVTPYHALGELVRLRTAGVKPVDLQLTDAIIWSAADLRERKNLLEDLTVHMLEVGNPQQHPWRGVRLPSVLPTDIDRLVSTVREILTRMESIATTSRELANLLQYGTADTLADCSMVAQLGKHLVKSPKMDRRAIASNAWSEHRQSIDELLEAGVALAECRKNLATVVTEVAWSTDVSAARRHAAAHGRSWFRHFSGEYRKAQATLSGILRDAPPRSLDDRLHVLDQLMQGQRTAQKLKDPQFDQLGQSAFGSHWRGVDSDWTALKEIATWESEGRNANIPSDFRSVMAQVENLAAVDALVKGIARVLNPLFSEIQQLFKQLELDLHQALATHDLRTVPFMKLRSRLRAWQGSPEGLTKWISYFTRLRKLKKYGLRQLAEKLDQGLIPARDSLSGFEMAYYEAIMRHAFQRYPDLANFNGVSHDQLLRTFRKLDIERITLARKEVALAHYQGLPTQGGESGEVGILRREMKKKRKQLPLRQLLQQAGHAVQAVKPVFMMSPISIAQYLEPGVLEFDLLLIDEASQVRPVDALGGVARAKQMAVVGDDRQLPPTQFFSRMISDEDEVPEGEFQTGDLESILGLCEGQNMPQEMLRWHYRSRHHSLIAVSNHEFYGDRLYVVPSPYNAVGGLGLHFRFIADGTFDRGGRRTNHKEAVAIADAVMEHARQFPDKTLGVGAFSVSQRDAILDELEIRRRQSPDLEAFFATSTAEPFFVKNLENIQGDERDVILISVGYGKDSSGYMAMSFGPLNTDGGERRLNVLITRARERCEVFSSITADDIDVKRTQARGVHALKAFLTYARSGSLDAVSTARGSYESEFERQVGQSLVAHGFQVDAQIGVAGFFVDLGIVDPERPGRYLLGIECDGASYHSSRSARDRDRLRQQVLEDRGWIIHRIWSTDWFLRPADQLRKVMASLEEAKATWASRSNESPQPHRKVEAPAVIESIDRNESVPGEEVSIVGVDFTPYEEANFAVDTTWNIHELEVRQLAKVVARVVEIEGPVHQDEIVRRIATLWGFKRAGARIANVVERALAEAVHQDQIHQHGLFFAPTNMLAVSVRNRENVTSANLRKPEYLPPAEIREALTAIVRVHLGMTSDEATTEVARLLGFRSTSSQLKQIILDEIGFLVEAHVFQQRNGKVYVDDATAFESV